MPILGTGTSFFLPCSFMQFLNVCLGGYHRQGPGNCPGLHPCFVRSIGLEDGCFLGLLHSSATAAVGSQSCSVLGLEPFLPLQVMLFNFSLSFFGLLQPEVLLLVGLRHLLGGPRLACSSCWMPCDFLTMVLAYAAVFDRKGNYLWLFLIKIWLKLCDSLINLHQVSWTVLIFSTKFTIFLNSSCNWNLCKLRSSSKIHMAFSQAKQDIEWGCIIIVSFKFLIVALISAISLGMSIDFEKCAILVDWGAVPRDFS